MGAAVEAVMTSLTALIASAVGSGFFLGMGVASIIENRPWVFVAPQFLLAAINAGFVINRAMEISR